MNTNLKYFILVAEELSITKAASKAYVSPQSMSAHIKRLEERYGVPLFTRKPFFSLTPAGDILYNAFKKIQITESDVMKQLDDFKKGMAGTIRFGIDTTRGQMLLHDIYFKFHHDFPRVVIEMSNGFTPALIPAVMRGELHFMLGNYWLDIPELDAMTVCKEHYFYVISDKLLKKFFDNWKERKDIMRTGVSIKDVEHIPLILTRETSYMRRQITRLFHENHVIPNVIFESNTHITNLEMAADSLGACFCPGMIAEAMLDRVRKEDGTSNDLCAYPLKNFDESHIIAIVYRKGAYIPPYVQNFINRIINTYNKITVKAISTAGE